MKLLEMATADEIAATIPTWVKSSERGKWYAKQYGYSGPTAYVRQTNISSQDISLDEFVQELLDWREGEIMDLKFEDAVRIARGCTDYGGGYRGNSEHYEIYQHGIQTVINALVAASKTCLEDNQVKVLHSIGSTCI